MICSIRQDPIYFFRSLLEALYELAYLRSFAAWEMCLEAVFYRSLCGYASAAGQETLVRGPYYSTLSSAEAAILRPGHTYALWHNPHHVIARCHGFIRSGAGCPSLQESTLSSNVSRLEHLAHVRHRIVHEQSDARRKFDLATINLAARTYPTSRPGKFLRDWDTSTSPQRRWLEVMVAELTNLVGQMV